MGRYWDRKFESWISEFKFLIKVEQIFSMLEI